MLRERCFRAFSHQSSRKYCADGGTYHSFDAPAIDAEFDVLPGRKLGSVILLFI
jgi:hypothetical protein